MFLQHTCVRSLRSVVAYCDVSCTAFTSLYVEGGYVTVMRLVTFTSFHI
jgi:hypothetical protein